jgi:hypothetical protein
VPIHKKNSTLLKGNYRPVSILPTISKIFERAIDEQLVTSRMDPWGTPLYISRKELQTDPILTHCFLSVR